MQIVILCLVSYKMDSLVGKEFTVMQYFCKQGFTKAKQSESLVLLIFAPDRKFALYHNID